MFCLKKKEAAWKDVLLFLRWTGSNTNPRNNDGQGLAGTDRSNLVLLRSQQYPEGSGWRFGPGGKYGHYGGNYPMHLDNVTFLGVDRGSLETLAFLDPGKRAFVVVVVVVVVVSAKHIV